MADFNQLAALLDSLSHLLGQLTEKQQAIVKAVRTDDLQLLGECMKHQQALALQLRSIDQKRERLQKELHIEQVKLSELPSHVPEGELRRTIRAAAERLSSAYRLMQSASEVARSSLECSLHEVEKRIAHMGLDPQQWQTFSATERKTDFRA